eukprot:1143037-Pelagomonas_calceolata.AAC.10
MRQGKPEAEQVNRDIQRHDEEEWVDDSKDWLQQCAAHFKRGSDEREKDEQFDIMWSRAGFLTAFDLLLRRPVQSLELLASSQCPLAMLVAAFFILAVLSEANMPTLKLLFRASLFPSLPKLVLPCPFADQRSFPWSCT